MKMDKRSLELCEKIIPATYVRQAENALRSEQNLVNQLLEQKRLPEEGFSDTVIERLLSDIASMDSNNFPGNCGAGEREGRIYNRIVANRHFHLAHGIGRSGELTSVQPKAAGSSVLAKLTNSLALHALKLAGAIHVQDCFVVPIATGMTLSLTFLTLRHLRPAAKYIIWPRVDQKSCFKSMITAGYVPVIVQNVLKGDELHTDMPEVERQTNILQPENILCVHSTTSCFSPRAPDDLVAIAKLCKEKNIPHIVNNAYGTQSSKCMHLIEEASRAGRLDAFVQSLDKNYMVPVGGTILASYDSEFLQRISKLYPGRASATPSIDLFITLLSMGSTGYRRLLQERKDVFSYLKIRLKAFADGNGEKILETPSNQISIGLTLTSLDKENCTMLGSMLFTRNISGARVIAPVNQIIEGIEFVGFGSHIDSCPYPYLTVAAAVGATKEEIDTLVSRLSKVFVKLEKFKKVDVITAKLS